MTRPVRVAAQNIRRALIDLAPEPGVETDEPAGYWVRGVDESDARWIEAADLETVLRGTASP